ncbi:hypothetical protein A5773_20070 [Mycobacterium sp. 852014-52450_SCH5900713]|uniref:hypothetical protein n=1 Tax=Mycobacterium sp. 852014-52450_SCH5900713 TaxID=1834116 RepID=UPI0007FBBD71|nr:hypothetical protein [Mycobacterium sp. 852014-52450_SCH5900713]OBF93046.1 hypothetical protein A5773_20070 [Mycobacterium sp. 852014-52450_SCH5900713]
MSVRRAVKRFGTPAYRASRPGQPTNSLRIPGRQVDLRQRRRTGLAAGHYGSDWSLAAEIAAVCAPLAQRIAAADRPARFRHSATAGSVPDLAEAVHELVGVVVGWVTEREALAKTAHLAAEPGKRRYAITTLCDLATRPPLPEVTAEALAAGSWSADLVAMAEGVDMSLSDMLSHAWPPGAAALRGQPSRSERLDALLRNTLDRAALALERRLDRDDERPAQIAQTTEPDPRAELAALGIATD